MNNCNGQGKDNTSQSQFDHLAELEIVKYTEQGIEPMNGGIVLKTNDSETLPSGCQAVFKRLPSGCQAVVNRSPIDRQSTANQSSIDSQSVEINDRKTSASSVLKSYAWAGFTTVAMVTAP